MAIKLIVGLGNPGNEHKNQRHNAGFWLLDRIYSDTFKQADKFFGEVADCEIAGSKVRLLKPTTYMNLSGKAVLAMAQFYKFDPAEVLILHDELDLEPGAIRLKFSGGAGGHNGLSDIISVFASKDFYRLRIGIGHPGDKSKVLNFVLNPPNLSQKQLIEQGFEELSAVLDLIITGQTEAAMNQLHSKKEAQNGL